VYTSPMVKRLAVVLAVVAVVAALLVARRWRTGRAMVDSRSAQGTGVDYRLSPMNAAFEAPDGGTPCETAYNALHAIDEGSRGTGMSVPWTTFPDRPTFLARCMALQPQEQECMQPRYAAQNHPVCDPIQNKFEKNNPLWGDGGPR
jgi:hypothetical protein